MTSWNKLGAIFGRRGSGNAAPSEPVAVDPQADVPQGVAEALVVLLADELRDSGRDPRVDGRIVNLANGITLEVELVESVRLAADSVRTSTRVTARHADAFPHGLAEFQHAGGVSTVESLSHGFKGWAAMDLVTLEDALLDSPRDSSVLRKTYDDARDGRSLEREAVLGPAMHLATEPLPAGTDDHPFCPCCLLMNCFDAFEPLLREDRVLGIRLYAAVHPDGEQVADCRVNGEEFAEGVSALLRYVSSWPRRGFEYRKQYVVMRTKPKVLDAAA